MTIDPDTLKGLDHGAIIARLMEEARVTFHQEESRKRSAIAKQAWARRREREAKA